MGIVIKKETPRDFNFINADADGDDHFNAHGKLRDRLKKMKGKIGDKLGGGKIPHVANKMNPLFQKVRAAIILMFRMNVGNVAAHLAEEKESNPDKWNKFHQKFWMWGGDKAVLSSAVDEGKGKKAAGEGILNKLPAKVKDMLTKFA
jgi:hypothetical protein